MGVRRSVVLLGAAVGLLSLAGPALAKMSGPFDVLTPSGEIRTVGDDAAERFWAEWWRLYSERESNCLSCDSPEQAAEVYQGLFTTYYRDLGGKHPAAYLIKPHEMGSDSWAEAYAFYPATQNASAHLVDLGGTGKKDARWDWWSVASPTMESIILSARPIENEGKGVVEWTLIVLSIAAFSAAIAWSVARRPSRR